MNEKLQYPLLRLLGLLRRPVIGEVKEERFSKRTKLCPITLGYDWTVFDYLMDIEIDYDVDGMWLCTGTGSVSPSLHFLMYDWSDSYE